MIEFWSNCDVSHHQAASTFLMVGTLGSRVAGRDRELFVARDDELAFFDGVLAGDSPIRIVHVLGTGGIGKSALLREVARRAGARGFDTVWLDGRDLPPFPAEVEAALHAVTEASPALVLFDSYEMISSLDSHLRDTVIPQLPDTTVVVFATRQSPSRGWFEHGWDTLVCTLELEGLPADDAKSLLRAHGVATDATADAIVRRSHGSPLALVVGVETGPGGSIGDLVDRLIGDEVDPAHYRILSVASLARVTTPELLEAVLGDADPQDSYKWLAARSFSESLASGVTLHPLVAEAVRERIRANDPVGEAALRRSIADHVHRRAVAGQQHGLSMELQHLVVDPNVRWGFASDVGNRYRIDRIRDGDVDRIGSILESIGVSEWWRISKVFFTDHPECCGVARDARGRVGGYFIAVAPTTAPEAAERDPLLGPWLRYARDELGTTSAVLWREAVDLTGEMGEVTSLLGAGGLLASGVANPRYGFLPISPLVPAALEFADALGAVHVPELDMSGHGMELACHVVDFGPGGMIGFQRDWIYRETGSAVPVDRPDGDPARLLRMLREPAALSHGPAWLGDTPASRLANLRRRVTAALDVFGPSHDDQLARTIVEAAFLGEAAPHEAIARRLHLSRSAYFRRLNAATSRVGEELVASARRSP
jgi:hypothetical protein